MNPSISVFLIFLTSLFSQLNSVAQVNLVPNPSFEIHDTCPDSYFQIHRALGWKAANGSPDYFHGCANWWTVSVPSNFRGYQAGLLVNDSAYAGIYISKILNQTREILYTELSQSMTIGRKYYVSFVLSPGYSFGSPCHCNKIGVKFINYNYPEGNGASDTLLINNFAHVYTDSVISDTSSWFLLEGSFIADSAYSRILIGTFYRTDSVSCFCRETTSTLSYYYVDRICVSDDSLYCPSYTTKIIPPDYIEKYSISYIDDKIQIVAIDGNQMVQILVFDLLGRKLLEDEMKDGRSIIDLSHFASSIYILKIGNHSYKFIH